MRSELERKVQREQIVNAVHTPDWTFKANYTLTACCAFRIRRISSPRAVSVISCVCRADSWSRYFTLYVQRSIDGGVIDILENTYLLMSVSFLIFMKAMCSHTIILLSWKSGVDLNPCKQLGQ